MSVKKEFSVLNDEDGYILINMYGTEFVSTEPIKMIDGKFKGRDVEKLVFERNLKW